MSFLPYLSFPSGLDYTPARLLEQHFGMGLAEDDLETTPTLIRGYLLRPRTQLYLKAKSGESEVVNDDKCFRVSLQIPHFQPEEISVKTVGDCVVVHGKHEERDDEHGVVSREFTRRYVLPAGAEAKNVKSSLTPDGVLVVEAPKETPRPPMVDEREVPIEVTPAKQ